MLPPWGTLVCTPDITIVVCFHMQNLINFTYCLTRKYVENMLILTFLVQELHVYFPRLALHEKRYAAYHEFTEMPLTQLLALMQAHFAVQKIYCAA